MRLIDADALMDRYGEPCHSFIDVIEDMPTIDAEPLRRGYWISADLIRNCGILKGVKCSLCGKEKIGKGYNFCPDCGARMDGETYEVK